MDPILVMDSKAEIRVGIIPDRKAGSPSSQVIARIALPGGCEVIASEMDEIVRKREISHWESSNGYVDLYWTSDQKATSRYLDIPILPRVEGVFRARPSVVYPYYESGKEYYAEPLKVRVINTFGVTLDENGRTTPPPGVPGTPFPRRG